MSWIERLRALTRRQQPNVKLEGACTMSGGCCRNLILVHRGKPIESHDQFQRMRAQDEEAQMFMPRKDVSADGLLRFLCRNLGQDNRCKIYDERPQMCRDYPLVEMFERGGSLLAGCGYRLVAEQPEAASFKEVLDRALDHVPGQRRESQQEHSEAPPG